MKRKGRWPNRWQFIMLPKQMIFSPEWQELSSAAKIIYVQMKGKFNGSNNGKIRIYYSELEKIKGLKSPNAISKGLRELETKEWVKRSKLGGLHRYVNEYELTGKYDLSLAWIRSL